MNTLQRQKNRYWFRLITIIVITTFLSQNICWSAPTPHKETLAPNSEFARLASRIDLEMAGIGHCFIQWINAVNIHTLPQLEALIKRDPKVHEDLFRININTIFNPNKIELISPHFTLAFLDTDEFPNDGFHQIPGTNIRIDLYKRPLPPAPIPAEATPPKPDITERCDVSEDYEEMSRRAAEYFVEEVKQLIEDKGRAVVCFASDKTSKRMYEIIAESDIDWTKVTTFNLDEYIIHSDTDTLINTKGSLRYDMENNLFRKLKSADVKYPLPEENINFLNGAAKDIDAEIDRYKKAIKKAGGFDLCILGIGRNAHLAFCEPETPFDSEVYKETLSETTRTANFDKVTKDTPSEALTVGLQDIMNSRKIMLLASSSKKQDAVQKAVLGPVTKQVPASILQRHSDVRYFINRNAYGGIYRQKFNDAFNRLREIPAEKFVPEPLGRELRTQSPGQDIIFKNCDSLEELETFCRETVLEPDKIVVIKLINSRGNVPIEEIHIFAIKFKDLKEKVLGEDSSKTAVFNWDKTYLYRSASFDLEACEIVSPGLYIDPKTFKHDEGFGRALFLLFATHLIETGFGGYPYKTPVENPRSASLIYSHLNARIYTGNRLHEASIAKLLYQLFVMHLSGAKVTEIVSKLEEFKNDPKGKARELLGFLIKKTREGIDIDWKKIYLPLIGTIPNSVEELYSPRTKKQGPLASLTKSLRAILGVYSNVHRGTGQHSYASTLAYEHARKIVGNHFGRDPKEHTVIFSTNKYQAILQQCCDIKLSADKRGLNGTTVISNIGGSFDFNDLPEEFKPDKIITPETLSSLPDLLSKNKVSLVALSSDSFSSIDELRKISDAIHKAGAKLLIETRGNELDKEINMKDLNIDFLVTSSSDYGFPLECSAMIARLSLLPTDIKEAPYYTGGGVVLLATKDDVTYADYPEKGEAGTPNIVGAVALARILQEGIKIEEGTQETDPSEIFAVDSELTIEELRGLLIGRDSVVPTRPGEENYTNLDNGASTPTFEPIMESVEKVLSLTRKAQLKAYEEARRIVEGFFGADPKRHKVIFTRNTTEGINLLAHNIELSPNAIVVNTELEHNSNELPWRKFKNHLRLPVDDDGFIDIKELKRLLEEHNKPGSTQRIELIAISGASNVLGTLNNIRKITKLARDHGAKVLVDAAQLSAHRPINMKDMGIDYLAVSGHKIYAPFGCSALITLKDNPSQLEEKGEPNILGAVAFAKSLNILKAIGMDKVEEDEKELTAYALEKMGQIPGIELYGIDSPDRVEDKSGVISFNINIKLDETSIVVPDKFIDFIVKETWFPQGLLAEILAEEGGIGVRNACFCAHILLQDVLACPAHKIAEQKERARRGEPLIPGAVRISLGIYNTKEDIDKVVDILTKLATGKYNELLEQYEIDENGYFTLPYRGKLEAFGRKKLTEIYGDVEESHSVRSPSKSYTGRGGSDSDCNPVIEAAFEVKRGTPSGENYEFKPVDIKNSEITREAVTLLLSDRIFSERPYVEETFRRLRVLSVPRLSLSGHYGFGGQPNENSLHTIYVPYGIYRYLQEKYSKGAEQKTQAVQELADFIYHKYVETLLSYPYRVVTETYLEKLDQAHSILEHHDYDLEKHFIESGTFDVLSQARKRLTGWINDQTESFKSTVVPRVGTHTDISAEARALASSWADDKGKLERLTGIYLDRKNMLSSYALEYIKWILRSYPPEKEKRQLVIIQRGANILGLMLKEAVRILGWTHLEIKDIYLNSEIVGTHHKAMGIESRQEYGTGDMPGNNTPEDIFEYLHQEGLLDGTPLTFLDTGSVGSQPWFCEKIIKDPKYWVGIQEGIKDIPIETRLLFYFDKQFKDGDPRNIEGLNQALGYDTKETKKLWSYGNLLDETLPQRYTAPEILIRDGQRIKPQLEQQWQSSYTHETELEDIIIQLAAKAVVSEWTDTDDWPSGSGQVESDAKSPDSSPAPVHHRIHKNDFYLSIILTLPLFGLLNLLLGFPGIDLITINQTVFILSFCIAIVVAVIAHEVAHYVAAKRYGIKQAAITWNRVWYIPESEKERLVALSGPLANWALGIISLIAIWLFRQYFSTNIVLFLALTHVFNILLGFLSLLPFGERDGKKIFRNFPSRFRIFPLVLFIPLLTGCSGSAIASGICFIISVLAYCFALYLSADDERKSRRKFLRLGALATGTVAILPGIWFFMKYLMKKPSPAPAPIPEDHTYLYESTPEIHNKEYYDEEMLKMLEELVSGIDDSEFKPYAQLALDKYLKNDKNIRLVNTPADPELAIKAEGIFIPVFVYDLKTDTLTANYQAVKLYPALALQAMLIHEGIHAEEKDSPYAQKAKQPFEISDFKTFDVNGNPLMIPGTDVYAYKIVLHELYIQAHIEEPGYRIMYEFLRKKLVNLKKYIDDFPVDTKYLKLAEDMNAAASEGKVHFAIRYCEENDISLEKVREHQQYLFIKDQMKNIYNDAMNNDGSLIPGAIRETYVLSFEHGTEDEFNLWFDIMQTEEKVFGNVELVEDQNGKITSHRVTDNANYLEWLHTDELLNLDLPKSSTVHLHPMDYWIGFFATILIIFHLYLYYGVLINFIVTPLATIILAEFSRICHEAGHYISARLLGAKKIKWRRGSMTTYDTTNLSSTKRIIIATSGPLMNLFLAAISILPIIFLPEYTLKFLLIFLFNVIAGGLSLLPLPGRDGDKIFNELYRIPWHKQRPVNIPQWHPERDEFSPYNLRILVQISQKTGVLYEELRKSLELAMAYGVYKEPYVDDMLLWLRQNAIKGEIKYDDSLPPDRKKEIILAWNFLMIMGLNPEKIERLIPGSKPEIESAWKGEFATSEGKGFGEGISLGYYFPNDLLYSNNDNFYNLLQFEDGDTYLDLFGGIGIEAINVARRMQREKKKVFVYMLDANARNIYCAMRFAEMAGVGPDRIGFIMCDARANTQGIPLQNNRVTKVTILLDSFLGAEEEDVEEVLKEVLRVSADGTRIFYDGSDEYIHDGFLEKVAEKEGKDIDVKYKYVSAEEVPVLRSGILLDIRVNHAKAFSKKVDSTLTGLTETGRLEQAKQHAAQPLGREVQAGEDKLTQAMAWHVLEGINEYRGLEAKIIYSWDKVLESKLNGEDRDRLRRLVMHTRGKVFFYAGEGYILDPDYDYFEDSMVVKRGNTLVNNNTEETIVDLNKKDGLTVFMISDEHKEHLGTGKFRAGRVKRGKFLVPLTGRRTVENDLFLGLEILRNNGKIDNLHSLFQLLLVDSIRDWLEANGKKPTRKRVQSILKIKIPVRYLDHRRDIERSRRHIEDLITSA